MGAGRNATSTSLAFPAPSPKGQRRSRAFKPGIWSGQPSRQGASKASILDGCWCGPVAPLTSAQNKAGCRASAIGFAPQFIAAMAIATKSERAIPPRSKDARPPGPISCDPLRSRMRYQFSRRAFLKIASLAAGFGSAYLAGCGGEPNGPARKNPGLQTRTPVNEPLRGLPQSIIPMGLGVNVGFSPTETNTIA